MNLNCVNLGFFHFKKPKLYHGPPWDRSNWAHILLHNFLYLAHGPNSNDPELAPSWPNLELQDPSYTMGQLGTIRIFQNTKLAQGGQKTGTYGTFPLIRII